MTTLKSEEPVSWGRPLNPEGRASETAGGCQHARAELPTSQQGDLEAHSRFGGRFTQDVLGFGWPLD